MMRSVAGGMRICIFGAGAVGGHIAAKLAASGNEVSWSLGALTSRLFKEMD